MRSGTVKVAVLGAGKMGVWFASFFNSKGFKVVLADRKKEKLAKLNLTKHIELTDDFNGAVKDANQVWLCVAIDAMDEVCKKISPAIKNQIILDVCSIKEKPVQTMHQHFPNATVLGTHPVFGPGSHGVKNKAFILTPTNPKEEKFAQELKEFLEKDEANVFVMTPKEHDELMAVVLGMPHFIGLIAAETLVEQKNYALTKKVSGTTYRMLFTLAESCALETPELFASLQTSLPALTKMEDSLIAKTEEWLALIKNKDHKTIIARMDQIKKKLAKADPEFAKSYEQMYKMLESTEEKKK